MATPRSKHIASNVANRYVAWFKYADLLSGADEKFQNLPDDGCRLAIANRVLMLCITLLTGVVLV
jgi:hypothetical protein